MPSDLNKKDNSGTSEPLLQKQSRSRLRVERMIARILAKQRLQQRWFLRHAEFENESNDRRASRCSEHQRNTERKSFN
jgi:hypothetical protein